jgi:hypothetical protein
MVEEVVEHGDRFLGDLLENPIVIKSGLEDVFRKCAEQTYWTYLDDSDYLHNSLGLMALKDVWDNEPNKQGAIVCLLDQFYHRGNWIVDCHVQDLAKEIGLEDKYQRD